MHKADKGAQKDNSDPSQIGPTLTLSFQPLISGSEASLSLARLLASYPALAELSL
jgi:hypothetical protein